VLLQACLSPNGNLSFNNFNDSESQTSNQPNFNSLAWVGPSSVGVGSCSAYSVTSLAQNGLPIAVTQPTSVTVSNSSGGGFYSDPACVHPTSFISITPGSSSATVFFSATEAMSAFFQASAENYNFASEMVNIFAVGAAYKLVFTIEPPTAAVSGSPFATQPVIEVQDVNGNLVSSGSYTLLFNAYSDSICTLPTSAVPTSSAPVSAGIATLSGFQVTASTPQIVYISASISGLNRACSSAINITEPVIPMVATSFGSTCALSSAGHVYCWGNNSSGQLGNNSTTNSTTPVEVLGVGGSGFLSGIVSIAGSSESLHFCAVNSSGNAYCWGRNANGELGNAQTTTSQNTPVEVLGPGSIGVLSNITSLSVGTYHTCAAVSSGSAYCWGDGSFGKLGDVSGADAFVPSPVAGAGGSGSLSGVKSVSAGGASSCAVTSSGNVYCWGDNNEGSLGNNTTTNSNTPVEVADATGESFLTGITSISVSDNYGACAVSSTGNVYCWGDNSFGQLTATGVGDSLIPIEVAGIGGVGKLAGISAVSYAADEVCVNSTSGGALCWGNGAYGSVGNGSVMTEVQDPTDVLNSTGSVALPTVASVSVGIDQLGGGYACAASAGNVYCWGANNYGQLGQGGTSSANNPLPLEVLGVGGAGVLSL